MAFTPKPQPLYSALSLITILYLLIFYPLKSTANVGVTVNLIPRDSPLSPFYNSSKTYFNRLHDAFQRSLKRVNHFKSVLSRPAGSKIQTQITPGGGTFLMNISIGTPPVEVLGIADTGSDLTWTQCLPCTECFQQKLPIFNPQDSSTYRTVSCQSSSCSALDQATCSSDQKTCEYSYSYGDGSHTSGDLSSETFRIGTENPVSLRNIVFGCGHDTSGTFDESESGLVGLGGGKLSFISQLDDSMGKKFSYCLVPTTTTDVSGKISFGSDAVVSSSGAVKTPLVAKSPDTFYFLTLEGISVGNQRIAYKGSTTLVPNAANDNEGNIIIDSGTTLTFLPTEFFDDLVTAVAKAINGVQVDDPNGLFSLCYNSATDLKVPILTAHFKGGDVKLQPLNTFIQVADDMVCLSLIGADDLPIYGNLAQMNFLVEYDLDAGTVSFLPTDCTKQ